MALAIDMLSWALILAGGVFGVIGGIGLLRFPDFFSRIHAAGVTDTMCAPLIIGGLMLQSGFSLTTVKLLFLVVFLFLTSPTASHALAKAALHGGEKPVFGPRKPPGEGQAAGEPGSPGPAGGHESRR